MPQYQVSRGVQLSLHPALLQCLLTRAASAPCQLSELRLGQLLQCPGAALLLLAASEQMWFEC